MEWPTCKSVADKLVELLIASLPTYHFCLRERTPRAWENCWCGRKPCLKAAHPSPFSAYRGFLNKALSQINQYLEGMVKQFTDWSEWMNTDCKQLSTQIQDEIAQTTSKCKRAPHLLASFTAGTDPARKFMYGIKRLQKKSIEVGTHHILRNRHTRNSWNFIEVKGYNPGNWWVFFGAITLTSAKRCRDHG